MTHGLGKNGHSLELDLAEQCPLGTPARAGIFAGKQGLAPGTAPYYLAGVFSPWKSVFRVELGSCMCHIMDGTGSLQMPLPDLS